MGTTGKVREALRALQADSQREQLIKRRRALGQDVVESPENALAFTKELLSEAFGEIYQGLCVPAQAGAFLVALNGILNRVEEGETAHQQARRIGELIADVAFVASSHTPNEWKTETGESESRLRKIVDIVGTGGDALDTFNASTAAGILVAAAARQHPNLRVAKQGSRSSSGRCGAADLMEALGARLNLTSGHSAKLLEELGFVFLFAPNIHRPSQLVIQTRRELGIRTVFNLIGPLLNPSRPNFMLVGVGAPELLLPYSYALSSRPWLQRAIVVHSLHEGLDEISPSGPTQAVFLTKRSEGEEDGSDVDGRGGWKFEERVLRPLEDFGIEPFSIDLVLGGSPQENSEVFRRVLALRAGGTEHADSQKLEAVLNFVAIQASAALYVAGVCSDLRSGVSIIKEGVLDGSAEGLLQRYIQSSLEDSH